MPATQRPNVVVFLTDQQRWDSTGAHGNPLDLTPNFDRLAARGTHVARAFTPQPLCTPARASLQTGLYATTHGCFTNAHVPLPPELPTLATLFGDADYRTAYIGKWHLAPRGVVGAVEAAYRGGYQDWLASNVAEFTSDAYHTTLYDEANRAVALPGYRVDALTDAAIRYLARHVNERGATEPLFLWLSHVEPHHQNQVDDFVAPIGYRERYAGRWTPPDLAALGGSSARHLGGYWGCVKRLDEGLGRLLDALVSLGIDGSTIVCFASDHGCHFRTRNAEYKRSCHESSIRLPVALCGPGFDGGGRVDGMVSLIDLPPTLLQAAGIDVPPAMQGRSFFGSKRGREELLVQISESQTARAARTRRWKYGVTAAADETDANACRASRYVEEFLYDLEHDPYELANLAGYASHADVSSRMRRRLLALMGEAGEPPAEICPAPPKPSGQRRASADEAEQ
jgi:arylsulfatase A-like enzyme